MSNSTNSSNNDTGEATSTNSSSWCNQNEFECYNVVDTKQLETSIWLSIAGGAAVLVLFMVLRNIPSWRRIYHKRATQMSDLMFRPPPFKNSGWVHRLLSFLYPVFSMRDVDLFRSCGIDSLMMVRINVLGAQVFFPMSIVGLSALLPIYRTSGYLEETETNADSAMLYSMANVASKNNVLWVPLVLFVLMTMYALYAVYFHICSYAAFRLLYLDCFVDVSGPLGISLDSAPAMFLARIRDERYKDPWWKEFFGFFFPWYMHRRDIEFVRLCKEYYETARMEMMTKHEEEEVEAACETVGISSVEDDDGGVIHEPVHDWWLNPEDAPISVNSVFARGGVLLGKSNWALRKRCRGQSSVYSTGARRQECWAPVSEYVVEYRDAGVVRMSREVTGTLIMRMDSGCDGVESRLVHLEKSLRMLFPTSFLRLVPAYYYRTVEEAVTEWDETVGKIHAMEFQRQTLMKKMDGRKGRRYDSLVKKVEKLELKLSELGAKKNDLEGVIAKEREIALSNPADTAAFAIFSNQADARSALQGEIGIIPEINMVSHRAPGPDEINFQALWSTAGQQRNALTCMLPIYIILILFPIGAITGALSNLTVALCGGTPETNKLYSESFCDSTAVVPLTLLTTIVPVSLSAFWDTFVMPLTLYLATQRLRMHSSFTLLDRAITIQLYVFSVVNTFVMGVLGGAAISQIGTAISEDKFVSLLGEALPGASNFFLNYVAVHTFFTNFFRFVWPHDGTVLFQLLRMLKLASEPFTDREAWIIRSAPSFRTARHYASFLLIYIIGLSYSVISPFVLPLVLGFFLSSWIAWRYNCIHFYEPCYNSLGSMWQTFLSCYIATLYIATFFVACIFISKSFFWQGAVMGVFNYFMIALSKDHMDRKITKYALATPLQMAHKAPTITNAVNDVEQMYTPSVLRPGAVGWFPEQGKVWEKYGLPKFVGPNPSKKMKTS